MSEKELERLIYTITANTVNLIMWQTGWNEDTAVGCRHDRQA